MHIIDNPAPVLPINKSEHQFMSMAVTGAQVCLHSQLFCMSEPSNKQTQRHCVWWRRLPSLATPMGVHSQHSLSLSTLKGCCVLSVWLRRSWAFHWNVRPKGVFAHFCVFPLIVLFPCAFLGIFSRFDVTFTFLDDAAVFVWRVSRGAIYSRAFWSSDVRHRSETLSHVYLGHYIWDTELRQCLISILVIRCETTGSDDEPFSCTAHVPASNGQNVRSSHVRHRIETLSQFNYGHHIWDTELRHCLNSNMVITIETTTNWYFRTA